MPSETSETGKSGESAGAISEDALLGGRVILRQPAAGYRTAMDPVLLAAAVPAAGGEQVLDVGTGVGAAALCLACRVPGARVFGIDVQRDLVRLAADNAKASGLRVDFMVGDLQGPPSRLAAGSFNHVMANPPYMAPGRGRPSPYLGKRLATVEGDAGLAGWFDFCLLMVRPRGSVTIIHRADRLDQILAAIRGRLGEIGVFPLWPGGEGAKPAKRIILTGRKGVATPMRILPGLVLHGPGGAYTPRAEAVLRHGHGLDLSEPP